MSPSIQTLLITLDQKDIPPEQMEHIRKIVPHARVIVTGKKEEMEPLVDQIDVLAGYIPFEWFPRARKLRWFQQWGAGVDWLLRYPEAARMDFILTNASGVHSIPISEHILALMLAFARRLPSAIRAQERHMWGQEWEKRMEVSEPAVFELAGKTMLLVGVGAIGRRTARAAHALGMRVVGIRRNPSQSEQGLDAVFGPDALLDCLPDADFVVLTIPLTQETRSMIEERALASMKRSAYLINIGRGGTVDEPALIAALQSGQIAGAGLDVFAKEPLPAGSPLWDLPNVIITPHESGDTPHYHERALAIFIDNLERYAKGERMKNVVDKARGY